MLDRVRNKVNLIGKQAVAGATEYPLWGSQAVYAFPTAAMQMEVVSASASDSAAGTGARTVEIRYLNASFVEKVEVVTLNGTTVVPTVATDIYRILSFRVKTAGSGQKAAGIIQLRNVADTPIYAYILANQTETTQCIYTVPAGKTLKIKGVTISIGSSAAGKSSTFSLKTNYDAENDIIAGYGASGIYYEILSMLTMDSAVHIQLDDPIEIPQKCDIIMTCVGTAAGIAVCDVRGELV